MAPEAKEKRIRITIPLPSLSLKRFIEKAINEEDFFLLALENPVGAMSECGVKLDLAEFIPSDFANFFGALTGLREIVKKKPAEKLTFEAIFGHAAEIRGTLLMAEMNQGFFREWDHRKAFFQKELVISAFKNFEVDRDRRLLSFQRLEKLKELTALFKIELDFVVKTVEHAETFRYSDTDWAHPDSVQERRSTSAHTKEFKKDGIESWKDLVTGPLINPVDLAELAARIEAFVNIQKGLQGK